MNEANMVKGMMLAQSVDFRGGKRLTRGEQAYKLLSPEKILGMQRKYGVVLCNSESFFCTDWNIFTFAPVLSA